MVESGSKDDDGLAEKMRQLSLAAKEPPRFLLIFDLNGILIDRYSTSPGTMVRSSRKSSTDGQGAPSGAICAADCPGPKASRLGNFLVWQRPGLGDFLAFAFAHFDVAVWSSVSPSNIRLLIPYVFGDLAGRLRFAFDQSRCEIAPGDSTNSAEPNCPAASRPKKPLFLKNLSEVWRDFPCYGPQNTLLVDNDDEKSRNNPPECHFNPGTWLRSAQDDRALFSGGHLRLLLEARALALRAGV